MKLALTEIFLDDLAGLPLGIQRKCREMLSSLRQIDPKNLREQALPGWRLHKLQSSPFISLSLDMNYRVLAKIEGEVVFFYRAVKHSLADSPNINRNDQIETPFTLVSGGIKPSDVYSVLLSLGLSDNALVFKGIETEDDLLDRLESVDDVIADYVLTVYETAGLVIPRTKYTFFQADQELIETFEKKQYDWDIYLHPSQKYLVQLPVNARYAVSGSAGTGKTVCAWYRLKHLALQKYQVGFVVPNQAALKVSQEKIENLLKGSPVECYYLVPTEHAHLIQLAESVDHVIIDEGQEISPVWYEKLGQALKGLNTGITIFFDLNQLGGSYQTGDTKRYEHRLSTWSPAIESIPNCNSLEFFINYRNSREIAEFYFGHLNNVLPNPVRSEIPIFSSGDVLTYPARDVNQAYVMITDLIKKVEKEYSHNEIGIISIGAAPKFPNLHEKLLKFNIATSSEFTNNNKILVTVPRQIRGHERKVIIIVCIAQSAIKDLGKAIEYYIAFSRARDRLFVIEIQGKPNA